MKWIYFLKYNNYTNRIVKMELSLQGYLGTGNPPANLLATIENCKLWNPNDGISTTIVTPQNTNFATEPDYLLAVDEYNRIDSRWFVIETVRLLRGQYRCTLRRDVFADAWEEFRLSKCSIDRAILSKYSPLIYNPEPISVNQIIQKETLLKDKTGVPWIVFYGSDVPQHVTIPPSSDTYDLTTPDKDTWADNHTFRYFPQDASDMQLSLQYAFAGYLDNPYHLDLIPNSMPGSHGNDSDDYYQLLNFDVPGVPEVTEDDNVPVEDMYVKAIAYLNAVSADHVYKKSEDYAKLYAYNGKIIYDSTENKFYKINVQTSAYHTSSALKLPASAAAEDLVDLCQNAVTNATNVSTFQNGAYVPPVAKNFIFQFEYRETSIVFEAATSPAGSYTAQVPASGISPDDSPYNMWCMPYGQIQMTYNGTTVTADPDLNLRVAMAFSIDNSSNKIYDFQILPFCPLPGEVIQSDGSISTDDDTLTDEATIRDSNNVTCGFIFAVPHSTFSMQIILESPILNDNPKLDSIIKMHRLYSPNYASSFEFSVAKNNGLIGFNVFCTYMPISPYIRVAPIWGGLYGSSTFSKDPRGLICTGDYSMPRISDAWVQYQENNKNYESIFNRQIENMDVMRKYQKMEQVAGAVMGTAAGALTGGLMGGVGAAVGGIGAAGTGIADLFLEGSKYRESRSYATDMHELQLGNVQAMPRTLAKTTAFNVDNRYFPVFVEYGCTSEEKERVLSFIAARSMTVGSIGVPNGFIFNRWSYGSVSDTGFIQGSIIRINSKHDTHFIDELNAEFKKGVYLR